MFSSTGSAQPSSWAILNPTDSVSMPGGVTLGGLSQLTPFPYESIVTAGDFSFTLHSWVYSAALASSNPFGVGKLVFAYQLHNDSAYYDSYSFGITEFSIFGFAGRQVAVAEGSGSGVNPGPAVRSGGSGNQLTFKYPEHYVPPPPPPPPGDVNPAPPIYGGEFSNILYVATDATAPDFTISFASVVNSAIQSPGGDQEVVLNSTPHAGNALAPSSVPDTASTSGLIGLALVLLAAGFRMRTSSLR